MATSGESSWEANSYDAPAGYVAIERAGQPQRAGGAIETRDLRRAQRLPRGIQKPQLVADPKIGRVVPPGRIDDRSAVGTRGGRPLGHARAEQLMPRSVPSGRLMKQSVKVPPTSIQNSGLREGSSWFCIQQSLAHTRPVDNGWANLGDGFLNSRRTPRDNVKSTRYGLLRRGKKRAAVAVRIAANARVGGSGTARIESTLATTL